MAGGLIDSLFVAIGFKVDDKGLKDIDNKIEKTFKKAGAILSHFGETLDKKGLKEFGGKLDGIAESAGKILTPMLSVVQGVIKVGAAVATTTFIIDRMTSSMLKNNQAFINFQRQTGLSIGKAQDIAQAGMLSDFTMNPEAALQSLQNVQSNLVGIGFGEGNLKPFQILGIETWGKDALQIFDDLRERIKGLDNATATYMLNQMGISAELLPVLRMSTEEIAEMRSLMLDETQRKRLQDLSTELRKIHMGYQLFKDKALIAILPYLIQFERAWLSIGKAFAPVLSDLGKLVKNIGTPLLKFLYHFAMAVAGLSKILTWGLIRPFNEIAEGIGKFISDHPKIISAISAIGLVALHAFNPVLALFTDLMLILEDIAVWQMGGKSFIGETIDIIKNKLNPNLNLGDTMRTASAMAGGGGGTANLNNHQTINQDNYISFNTPDAQPVARKITDLTFAYMQADRTV